MFTVIETPVYSRKARRLLSNKEREKIAVSVFQNPSAGTVVKGLGDIRIVCHNRLLHEEIWLLSLYSKSERPIIQAHAMRLISEAIEYE